MKIKVHMDKQKYTAKPLNNEVGKISNRIIKEVQEMEIYQIMSYVTQGYTILPALMDGKSRSIRSFVSQQMVMLDFDNTKTIINTDGKKEKVKDVENYITIEDMMKDTFILDNASYIYKTFNYTENHERFRVVFVLDTLVTDASVVQDIYLKLQEKYPTADAMCKDVARLYYGGSGGKIINFDNTLSVSEFVTDKAIAKNNINLLLAEVRKEHTATVQNTPSKRKRKRELQEQQLQIKEPAELSLVEEYENVKPVVIDNCETPVWQLIKNRDIETLKIKLQPYNITVESRVQAVKILKSINMVNLLELPKQSPFKDLFHEDANPSSGVFKLENSSVYLYKCHSENFEFTGDVMHVVAKLLNVSREIAIAFLMDVCGIEVVETGKIKAIKDKTDLIIDTLLSEEFKTVYPAVHSIFWRYKTDVVAILNIFKQNIIEDANGNLRCISWIGVRGLSTRLYGTDKKKNKVSNILKLMVLTKWIAKLDNEDIPKTLLDNLLKIQNTNKHAKRTDVYELLEYDSDFFQVLNDTCLDLKAKNFSMFALSKEYLIKTFGMEVANEVYKQDKDRVVSKKSTEIQNLITESALNIINEFGFVPEKELINILADKLGGKGFTEYKYKQCREELIEGYGLKRKRLSKEDKEEFPETVEMFQISTKASPTILKMER